MSRDYDTRYTTKHIYTDKEKSNMEINRRELLGAASGITLFGSTGCASIPFSDNDSSQNQFTEFKEGEAAKPSDCSKGTAVKPRWRASDTGPIGGFTISISQFELSEGESFECSIRNITEKTKQTGARKKFDIQYKSGSKWFSIYSKKGGGPLDHLVSHKPGTGFSWRFTASKEGLSATGGRIPSYYVCGEVDPGEYRFVYWGLTNTNKSLAIPFSIKN